MKTSHLSGVKDRAIGKRGKEDDRERERGEERDKGREEIKEREGERR